MLKSYILPILVAHVNQIGLQNISETKSCGQVIPDEERSQAFNSAQVLPSNSGLIEAALSMQSSAP